MSTKTLDQLLERIAQHVDDRDHYGSFEKPASGPPTGVVDKKSLLQHMKDIINDPNTKSFVASEDGKKVYFYNSRTNTVVILDPSAPGGGSAYRPKNASQGERWFEKQKELWLAGAPGRTITHHEGGLEGAERRLTSFPHAPPHATPHGEGRIGRIVVAVGVVATAISASNSANAQTSTGAAIVAAGREIVSALIPFTSAVTAAYAGKPAEALASFIGDCSWIGMGASEALRPMLRAMGADVEPGTIESAISNRQNGNEDPRKRIMMNMVRDIPAMSAEDLIKKGVPYGSVYEVAVKKYEVQEELDKINKLMNGRKLEDLSPEEVEKYARSLAKIQSHCRDINRVWSREVENKLGPSQNYGGRDPIKILKDQIEENLTRGQIRGKSLAGFLSSDYAQNALIDSTINLVGEFTVNSVQMKVTEPKTESTPNSEPEIIKIEKPVKPSVEAVPVP